MCVSVYMYSICMYACLNVCLCKYVCMQFACPCVWVGVCVCSGVSGGWPTSLCKEPVSINTDDHVLQPISI